MRHILLTGLLATMACVTVYGQSTKKVYFDKTMDTSKLDKTVKAAFEAWQAGDAKTWLSYFVQDAELYDDGNPRNFRSFVAEACGHERFTNIDEVKDGGLSIYGKFHTESWGDFKTYFKFHLNSQGKFDRLDIGQATN